MKQTVVLYPGGGAGHLGPMAQLAKVFLQHGYDVTMVVIEPPFTSTDFNASYMERVAASNPNVTFHVLPPIPAPDFASSDKHPFLLMRNTDTHGVLVNTFESMERRAVKALGDPRCVPGRTLPPVYCVGPLWRIQTKIVGRLNYVAAERERRHKRGQLCYHA
ncbi:hypothetical protein EJB05_16635, partial [Eragrostis curvula]